MCGWMREGLPHPSMVHPLPCRGVQNSTNARVGPAFVPVLCCASRFVSSSCNPSCRSLGPPARFVKTRPSARCTSE